MGARSSGLLRDGAATRPAAALDALAGGDGSRALRTAGDPGQSAAPVLDLRRRRNRRHGGRLSGAGSLGPPNARRQRRRAGVLFGLARACPDRHLVRLTTGEVIVTREALIWPD